METTPLPRSAGGPLQVLADAWTVARRNLIHIRRVPEKLADVTIQPVMFVFMFAYIFGSAIVVPGGDYRAFLMPGIFAQSMAFASMSIMSQIVNDMSKGVMDRFRSLPMARAAVLIGHTTSALLEGVLGLAVMVACGLVVGWRPHGGPGATLAAVGLLLLLSFGLMWIGTFVALFLRSVEAVQGIGFVLLFPFTFVANTFVPTAGMPPWLRVVANWNPMSATVAACRQLFGNAVASAASAPNWPLQHPVAAALVFGLGITAIFLPLAVWRFQSVTSR
jgi:ABC transporter DrrB family efflux protein